MKKDAIYRAHIEHPDWHRAEIARQLGVSRIHVARVARDLDLKIPNLGKDRQRIASTVMRLGWAAVAAGLSVADIEQIGKAKRVSA